MDHHAATEYGVFLPLNSVVNTPGALRDVAQAAEELGYTRLVIPEHVLGAHPDRPGGWTGAYTHADAWREPLVTFGFLSAVTTRIQFMTGILVLPQRATALVAKQIAEIDVLSGGRFVLGIGTGWNAVEYEALGREFRNRGRRYEEQITLLRRLWSEPVVTFEGTYERVTLAGINPLPTGPIPIWMGGHSDAALDRIGRTGDGWFQLLGEREPVERGMARIRAVAEAAGRDPGHIGMQARVQLADGLHEQVERAEMWRDAGATHIVAGEPPGMRSPGELIESLRAFMAAVQHH